VPTKETEEKRGSATVAKSMEEGERAQWSERAAP